MHEPLIRNILKSRLKILSLPRSALGVGHGSESLPGVCDVAGGSGVLVKA